MLGRLYFARQAASLLKFAKATSNPELAAVLVQKAADLKAQTDHPRRPADDKSPRAPDVEQAELDRGANAGQEANAGQGDQPIR